MGGCLEKPVCATTFVFVCLSQRTLLKLGCSGLLPVGEALKCSQDEPRGAFVSHPKWKKKTSTTLMLPPV